MRPALLLTTLCTMAVSAGGCGGSPSTETVTVTTPFPIRKTTKPRHSTAHRRHKNHATSTTTTKSPTLHQCDPNIAAKIDTTSCEFAENVFWVFWHAYQEGASTFRAFSPVTQRHYDVSCTGHTNVICKAANGAEVRFPMRAVAAYDSGQADRYEATHDTGTTDASAPPDASSTDGRGGCDPNYAGACLVPNSPDYAAEVARETAPTTPDRSRSSARTTTTWTATVTASRAKADVSHLSRRRSRTGPGSRFPRPGVSARRRGTPGDANPGN